MFDNKVSPGVFIKEIDKSGIKDAVLGIGNCIIGPTEKGPAFVPMSVRTYDEFVRLFGEFDPDKYLVPKAIELILKNSTNVNVVRVLGSADSDVDESLSAGFALDKNTILSLSTSTGGLTSIAEIWHESEVSFLVSAGTLLSGSGFTDEFTLNVSGSATAENGDKTLTLSPSSTKYLAKVLNTDPLKFRELGYVLKNVHKYFYNEDNPSDFFGNEDGEIVAETNAFGASNGYQEEYKTPQTSWLMSQYFGEATSYKLFKFWALSDGEWANRNIKVTVSGIAKSVNENVTKYGTFNILVRKFSDTDKEPEILEFFTGLNFNPASENFIAKRVGDRRHAFDSSERKLKTVGSYPNASNYIVVELHDELLNGNVPEEAVPFGFNQPPFITDVDMESALVERQYIKGNYSTKRCYGFNFEGRLSDVTGSANAAPYKHDASLGAITDYVPEYFNPVFDGDVWFSLCDLSGSFANPGENEKYTSNNLRNLAYTNGTKFTSLGNVGGTSAAKFTTFFWGGFDGLNPFVKSNFYTFYTKYPDDGVYKPSSCLGYNDKVSVMIVHCDFPFYPATSDFTGGEVEDNFLIYSLRKALDIVSDPDFIDINLLAMPGITNKFLNDYAITKCEERGDCLFISEMAELYTPVGENDDVRSIDSVLNYRDSSGFDSSYACTYYPHWKKFDEKLKKYVWLPPSIGILRSIALTDKMAFPWFSPAGFTRGGIPEATQVYTRTTFTERENLYQKGINPIAQFPNEGIVIWGQKTLQVKESLLNRVNVRRMVIHAKKAIASAAKFLVFEQNDAKTWERFVDMVRPILMHIKNQQGLTTFDVIADSRTTSLADVNRGVLKGYVIVQPTPALEQIQIGFIISNEGASFEF